MELDGTGYTSPMLPLVSALFFPRTEGSTSHTAKYGGEMVIQRRPTDRPQSPKWDPTGWNSYGLSYHLGILGF